MNMSTRAFIDNVPLSSAADINWQITEGVRPFETTFVFERSRGFQVIESARAKPKNNPYFTLRIQNPDSSITTAGTQEEVAFKNLVLVSYEPHNDPRFIRLNFADNRIFWFRAYFRGDFNIRTSLGDKIVTRQLEGVGPVLDEFGGSIPLNVENRIQYRTYSLYPPLIERDATSAVRPWTVSEMIMKILRKLKSDIPLSVNLSDSNFSVTESDLGKVSFINEVLKEDIELDGPSHSALAGVLELVPNIGVYVDKNGDTRFFSRHDGGEEKIIQDLPFPHAGSNVPFFVDNKFFVPEYVEVQFESEIEVRFDYIERLDVQILDFPSIITSFVEPTAGAPAGLARTRTEGRYLENVIPVPDPGITIEPVSFDKEAYFALTGQYVNIDDYIASLALPANTHVSIPFSITKPFLRENLLNALAPSFSNYVADTFDIADVRSSWNRRIDAIKSHYRRTYRINSFWRNRMMNTKASRVAYISTTEPLRAPSPVFFNYAKKLTTKGSLAVNKGIYFNVFCYDFDLTAAASVPWAYVNFTGDEENSIFNLSLDSDPYGHNEIVYPYAIANFPDIRFGYIGTTHCMDDFPVIGPLDGRVASGVPPVTVTWEGFLPGGVGVAAPSGSISPDHELSTIITSTPVASPGVKMFSIKVFPSMLEGPMENKLVGASGPPLVIKVPASTQTARFIWNDNQAADIEEAFGIRLKEDGTLEDVSPDYDSLGGLLVNIRQLIHLATQFASEQYAPYVPRKRGGATSFFTDVEPNGTISAISHLISSPNGKATTSYHIDEEYRPPNWIQMLPSSIRAFIQKFVKRDAP